MLLLHHTAIEIGTGSRCCPWHGVPVLPRAREVLETSLHKLVHPVNEVRGAKLRSERYVRALRFNPAILLTSSLSFLTSNWPPRPDLHRQLPESKSGASTIPPRGNCETLEQLKMVAVPGAAPGGLCL